MKNNNLNYKVKYASQLKWTAKQRAAGKTGIFLFIPPEIRQDVIDAKNDILKAWQEKCSIE